MADGCATFIAGLHLAAAFVMLKRGSGSGTSGAMKNDVLVLSYSGCGTCKKALKWLSEHGVDYRPRPIVDEPPTKAELARWVPRSGVSVRKWLNTSGQSYRALGKAKVDAASDAQVMDWLAADGKLVKRPVLVMGDTVLVGFKPEAYEQLFS